MRSAAALSLIFSLCKVSQAIGLGYNSQCLMDSECRVLSPLSDICCALLIYESNGVTIKQRECLARSAMDDANGNYDF